MNKFFIAIVLVSATFSASAADPAAGKAAAASCAGCHGQEGISMNPEWPNLAGQQETYLFNQLVAFKNGERKSPLMSPMAAALSEEDMANIAAYFANLK